MHTTDTSFLTSTFAHYEAWWLSEARGEGSSVNFPNWVTGFCDRSGSFILLVSKLKSGKWQLSAAFEVLINERYLYLLEILQSYFKAGRIFKTKNGNAVFRVNKINDLKFVSRTRLIILRLYLYLALKKLLLNYEIKLLTS